MKFIGRLASVAIAIAVSSYGVRASDGCPDKCKDNTQCPGGCCAKQAGDSCTEGLFDDNECENTDLVVGCNSCVGTNACKEISGLSSIGRYSCREDGDEQCRKITSTTIGDYSCLGGGSAGKVVGVACKSVSNSVIGSHSCQNTNACQGMDDSTIGDDSCRDGLGACNDLDNYRVGPHSCKGWRTCYNFLTGDSIDWHHFYSLGKAKEEFEDGGGTCTDGTKPALDIQPDTCVGDSMCNMCPYYLGCLPPGRCNEHLSPGDVLPNPEGDARCSLCYEAGSDRIYTPFVILKRHLSTRTKDSEGNLFGDNANIGHSTIENNSVPFSCDQIGNLIAKQLTERLIQDVLDRFDFSMGAIRFELVDEGEDYCRIKIGYPPSVSDRPTDDIVAEFKAEVRRLIREEDMLKSLRVKYPTAFEFVKEIVISDGKDGDSRKDKPKRSKKSKAKKRGKGKKRSKGNKSSKDTRNMRAI